MTGWNQTPDDSKLMLSLSAELLVAGELLRRQYPVLLTFGGAKKWDIVIKADKALFRVEVVAACDPKWSISGVRRDDSNLLVFVLLPRDSSCPAEYFVLTKSDLRSVVVPKETAANERNTMNWTKWRAHYLEIDDIEPYRGNWDRIAIAAGLPRRDWTGDIQPE